MRRKKLAGSGNEFSSHEDPTNGYFRLLLPPFSACLEPAIFLNIYFNLFLNGAHYKVTVESVCICEWGGGLSPLYFNEFVV